LHPLGRTGTVEEVAKAIGIFLNFIYKKKILSFRDFWIVN
jgi:hypothetical protein